MKKGLIEIEVEGAGLKVKGHGLFPFSMYKLFASTLG
jgi:hypothetical protein